MAYELLTRTGRSFWEVTSAMQNAIRKGDYNIASYALWELLPQYESYLRKRLLVISAEDCYGIITKEILVLCSRGGEEALSKALSLLCLCKKNRDADYFVCNLMFGDYREDEDKTSVSQKLFRAIRNMDVYETGRLTSLMFQRDRKKLWEILKTMAKAYYPYLDQEVMALYEANQAMTKPAEETIFVAKAICLFWTKREHDWEYLGYEGMTYSAPMPYGAIPIIKPVEECMKIEGNFPEWCYNWHTTYGKYKLRRDAVHAITNDQRLLTPLEVNLFDDCTWNRDLNACLLKHNPRGYKLPYDDHLIDPATKYGKKK